MSGASCGHTATPTRTGHARAAPRTHSGCANAAITRFATRATATASRPDVAGAYPGWGADHGYSVSVPATPGQQVCTYAINTLQGTSNTTLGCRTA